MPTEVQSPQEQLNASLAKLTDLGVKRLNDFTSKTINFSPELATLVSTLIVSLAVAGVGALLKKIETPAATPTPSA